jgi:hypothetical protein
VGEATEAAAWLSERLTEYAPRFASESDRDTTRLSQLVDAAVEQLHSGADVRLASSRRAMKTIA